MPEINLLPDDLRSKEKKELEAVHKKPKVFNVSMSSPSSGKVDQPLKASKPSLMSRLFAKKTEKPNMTLGKSEPKASSSDFDNSPRETKIKFDIPKISLKDNDSDLKVEKTSLSSGLNTFENKIDSPKASFNTTEEVKFKPVAGATEVKKEIINSKQPTEEKVDKLKPKKEKKKWFSFSFGKKKDKKEKNSDLGLVTDKKMEVKEDMAGSDNEKVKVRDKKHKDKRHKHYEGGSLDVNLIPDELARHPELELPRKLTISGILIFLVVLLMFGAYFGITWYQLNLTKQIGQLEAEINDFDRQIAAAQVNKDSAVELQKKVKTVKDLLDGHVYWTKFFTMLEKYTATDVYFSNFAMTGQDKLVLSAVGRDYESVARQLVAFQEATDFVKSVRIDSASSGTDLETGENSGVSFNINLEFQPGVFLKPAN